MTPVNCFGHGHSMWSILLRPPEQAMHGTDQAQMATFFEQSVICLDRWLVAMRFTVQGFNYRSASAVLV